MAYKIKGGKLTKPQVRSVFDDIESECADPNAPPLKVQVEFVGTDPENNPTEAYLVINGERAAYRSRDGGVPAWIPMRDGLVFHSGIPVPGTDTVQ